MRHWRALSIFAVPVAAFGALALGVVLMRSPPQAEGVAPRPGVRASMACPLCGDWLHSGPYIICRKFVNEKGEPIYSWVCTLMCRDCWDNRNPHERLDDGITAIELSMAKVQAMRHDGPSHYVLYYETIVDNLVLAAHGCPQTAGRIVMPGAKSLVPDSGQEEKR